MRYVQAGSVGHMDEKFGPLPRDATPREMAHRFVALHTRGIICLGEVWNLVFDHATPETLEVYLAECTPEVHGRFAYDAEKEKGRDERERTLLEALRQWYAAHPEVLPPRWGEMVQTAEGETWQVFYGGATVGEAGTEGGLIVADEEHANGARITLEQGGRNAPWAITCGVYGSFLHTALAASEDEARVKFAGMRRDLATILRDTDPEARYERMRRFSEVY